VQFVAHVNLGSNKQAFRVVFDTGSSDFWVTDSSCKLSVCAQKLKYHPEQSVSHVPTDSRFVVRYGTGAVKGAIAKDALELVPGLILPNQTVGKASSLTDFFERIPIDGILGLAFPSLAHRGMRTILQSLSVHQVLKQPVFSFYLSSHPGDDRSEVIFGEVDQELCTEPIKWASVVEENYVRPLFEQPTWIVPINLFKGMRLVDVECNSNSIQR
jgi:hypothetical protein